jgi:Na+-driven multidrug efflux pump
VAIAVVFGVLSTTAAWLGGPALYARMGGSGESLHAALTYSGWVFAGATLVWVFNALASVLRGTGNMTLPATVTLVGTIALVPVSPALIFGVGPLPGLGVAGGAIALLVYYAAGTAWLAWAVASGRNVVRPRWRGFRLRGAPLVAILRIGLAGAISTVATNVSIAIATGLSGQAGTAAIAGYGTASRLEYLLVPLVFGLGAPLVALVGTCIGAGQRERALRATWIGAAMAGALTEAIGLVAAIFPGPWIRLFTNDPGAIAAGVDYLRIVAPTYGFFGIALLLYFASQGAGRLLWPVLGNVARLFVAAAGGWLALRAGWGLVGVFSAQATALVVYGAVNAGSLAAGAWFGPPVWRHSKPVHPAGAFHEA